MAFSLKPRLSGENSIIVALATVGLVLGIYNMKIGPVTDVAATDAYDGNMASGIKKAGWQALIAVTALTVLAVDPNVLILGGGTIIYEELTYRHALMASPESGQIQVTPAAYMPAGTPAAAAQGGNGGGQVVAIAG